ncbi:hypothetical protein Clacol_008486 [Clathrus columnatus]|uniref:Uncharacterized protein n=1 Tax=Clathrus columnatus TaxID=1419009 RepID=A0AAV5AM81_9AGAM|nr:hypothetical protein Clacol_008486 [Clathrus columnatus]
MADYFAKFSGKNVLDQIQQIQAYWYSQYFFYGGLPTVQDRVSPISFLNTSNSIGFLRTLRFKID